MTIRCVWEHNGHDTLLFARDFVGAFTRAASRDKALAKMPEEIRAYLAWKTGEVAQPPGQAVIVQEKESALQIADADSDVLFESEKAALTRDAFDSLCALAMKSAQDFGRLYSALPDPDRLLLPRRKTFYGEVPATAHEIYVHTRSVTPYYFGEIGVAADEKSGLADCRARGFEAVIRSTDFLQNRVFDGSYDEQWTLRKVCRRFVWHDRIHAKALWRGAVRVFGVDSVPDVFCFGGQRSINAAKKHFSHSGQACAMSD